MLPACLPKLTALSKGGSDAARWELVSKGIAFKAGGLTFADAPGLLANNLFSFSSGESSGRGKAGP